MLREQFDHVFEKGQADGNARLPAAVEIKFDAHVSLFRLAVYVSGSHFIALNRELFSSGVPTLNRKYSRNIG
jgi:hypothetical protein